MTDLDAIAYIIARQNRKLLTVFNPTMAKEMQVVLIDALANLFVAEGFQGCPGCVLCGAEGEPPSFDRTAWVAKARGEVKP